MNTSLINDLSNLQPTDFDAGQVFSGKPSGTTVRGYAIPSTYPRPLTTAIFYMSPAAMLWSGFSNPADTSIARSVRVFLAPVQAVREWRPIRSRDGRFLKIIPQYHSVGR